MSWGSDPIWTFLTGVTQEWFGGLLTETTMALVEGRRKRSKNENGNLGARSPLPWENAPGSVGPIPIPAEMAQMAAKGIRPNGVQGEIAGRLLHLHRSLNEGRPRWNLAEMSGILGLPRPSDFERLLQGEEPVDFAFLDHVAKTFGAHPEWVKYGRGQPFRCSHESMLASPKSLLACIRRAAPTGLHFMLAKDEMGRSTLVGEFEPHRFRVLFECLHVSSVNGGGGTSRLCAFRGLIELLRQEGGLRLQGGAVSSDAFDALIDGSAWPGVACGSADRNLWWDDFTNLSPAESEFERWYGKGFVDAQQIVRYALAER